jgi:hypothetical protein
MNGTRGGRRSIAREHLLGATVWAYGGGGARVRPWTQCEQFSRFGGVREVGESQTGVRESGQKQTESTLDPANSGGDAARVGEN